MIISKRFWSLYLFCYPYTKSSDIFTSTFVYTASSIFKRFDSLINILFPSFFLYLFFSLVAGFLFVFDLVGFFAFFCLLVFQRKESSHDIFVTFDRWDVLFYLSVRSKIVYPVLSQWKVSHKYQRVLDYALKPK